jgi:hypothetical protein
MSATRRLIVLVVLAAAMLALAIIVFVRNRALDDDLLATIGILGALAVLVTNLPRREDDL